MKRETIAIHGGYEVDPTTKAVAVPIYQTVAYAFDSADMPRLCSTSRPKAFATPASATRPRQCWSGASPRSRVAWRPVREQRPGSGQLCRAKCHRVGKQYRYDSPAYGTTHTLFAHLLPSQGVTVRFAESDRPEAVAKLIDEKTRAVFCESVGNPAGNICDIEDWPAWPTNTGCR